MWKSALSSSSTVSTSRASSSPPSPPLANTSDRATRTPRSAQCLRMNSISSAVSVGKRVDGDNDRHAELLHVVQMGVEVGRCRAFERVHVGLRAARSWRTPPLYLSARTVATSTMQSGDNAGHAALDVHELLSAEVRAEACLGDRDSQPASGRRLGRLNASCSRVRCSRTGRRA